VNPRDAESCSEAARPLEELVQNLATLFRDEMLENHVEELVQLWEGAADLREQYRELPQLTGRRPRRAAQGGPILPGLRGGPWGPPSLLAIRGTVTEPRRAARAQLRRKRGLCARRASSSTSPVSPLGSEDFSGIKQLLDDAARARNQRTFRVFTDVTIPSSVQRCIQRDPRASR